jgi:peptidoglycan hydrolase CwlO-like protein
MAEKLDPLLPKWNKAKNESDALKKGKAFKPDIVPAIKKYDQAETDYEKLMEQKAKLKDILTALDKKLQSDSGKYDKLTEQREKVTDEDNKKFEQYSRELDGYADEDEPDPAKVLQTLDGWVDSITDYVTMTKAINDQISKFDTDGLSVVKKARDEFKSKSAGIEAQLKKIETAGKAAEAEVRSIALSYEKAATKMSDTDTVNAVRGFVKEMG